MHYFDALLLLTLIPSETSVLSEKAILSYLNELFSKTLYNNNKHGNSSFSQFYMPYSIQSHM